MAGAFDSSITSYLRLVPGDETSPIGFPNQEDVIMTKQQWVEVFRATGLDEAAMQTWHREFEARYPEGHQAFLQWLNIPPEEIGALRRA